MALGPESVPQQSFASLQSCLVEGDPEQRLTSGEYAAKRWLRLYFCKRVFSLW